MSGTEQARAEPAGRVDEILRAACRVVVEAGASELRIGTVAREAGVSRTLVHYYFTTRQELLRAAFDYAEERRALALDLELGTLATGAERTERALLRTIEPELEETPALVRYAYLNVAEARTRGAELGASWQPIAEIGLEGSVTWLDARDLSADRPLEGRAPLRGTLSARLAARPVLIELTFHFSGSSGIVSMCL